jgi:hypothetical protein
VENEPRRYTGWKASLIAIAITFVVFAVLNVVARRYAPKHRPTPPPTLVTATPSG